MTSLCCHRTSLCSGAGRTAAPKTAPRPALVAAPRRVAAHWATRLKELQQEDSREAKIQHFATTLGLDLAAVSHMVAQRPGVLLMHEQAVLTKINKLSHDHGIPPSQIAQLVANHPNLLF